jgi:hypothetical protein
MFFIVNCLIFTLFFHSNEGLIFIVTQIDETDFFLLFLHYYSLFR